VVLTASLVRMFAMYLQIELVILLLNQLSQLEQLTAINLPERQSPNNISTFVAKGIITDKHR
jgi:hypothetical protein